MESMLAAQLLEIANVANSTLTICYAAPRATRRKNLVPLPAPPTASPPTTTMPPSPPPGPPRVPPPPSQQTGNTSADVLGGVDHVLSILGIVVGGYVLLVLLRFVCIKRRDAKDASFDVAC